MQNEVLAIVANFGPVSIRRWYLVNYDKSLKGQFLNNH
jgi:hypothetical protein